MEETFGIAHLVQQSLSTPVAVQLHGPFFANGLETKLPREPGAGQRTELEGVAIAAADGIAAPSREILERTCAHDQLPLAGAIVSPPPAPVVPQERRWKLANCDRNAILFVGRFDRHKHGDIMIQAFRRIAPNFPSLRLWFVGRDPGFVSDGGREVALPEYLVENTPEIAGRVDALGRIPASELDALRSKPYLTVVPLRYQSSGTEVLEAMAHGCPLVAIRASAISENVQDGTNGLLCFPDAEDLAASLRRLLENPTLAAELGERAGDDAARRCHPESLTRDRAEFHREIIQRDAAKRRRTA